MRLEVGHGSSRQPLGRVHNAAWFYEDLRLTLVELDRLVDSGLLARLEHEEFEVEFSVDAPEDWRDFVNRPRAGGLDAHPAQLTHAEEALSRREAIMIVTEGQLAAAFRRIL
jgi:hypothetical protein